MRSMFAAALAAPWHIADEQHCFEGNNGRTGRLQSPHTSCTTPPRAQSALDVAVVSHPHNEQSGPLDDRQRTSRVGRRQGAMGCYYTVWEIWSGGLWRLGTDPSALVRHQPGRGPRHVGIGRCRRRHRPSSVRHAAGQYSPPLHFVGVMDPFCGMTRGVAATLRGDMRTA